MGYCLRGPPSAGGKADVSDSPANNGSMTRRASVLKGRLKHHESTEYGVCSSQGHFCKGVVIQLSLDSWQVNPTVEIMNVGLDVFFKYCIFHLQEFHLEVL